VRVAKVGEPLVVDSHQFDSGLSVIQPASRAEDPIEYLGLNTVALLIFQAQLRVGEPSDAALAVFVETGRGHAIGTVDLAGDVLAPGRPHAVQESEIRAVLRHPHRPFGSVSDVGHAVLHRRRGARGEEVRRQPAEIDVAVSRDSGVAHQSSEQSIVYALRSLGKKPLFLVAGARERCQGAKRPRKKFEARNPKFETNLNDQNAENSKRTSFGF
jgi:hypothetical protein